MLSLPELRTHKRDDASLMLMILLPTDVMDEYLFI